MSDSRCKTCGRPIGVPAHPRTIPHIDEFIRACFTPGDMMCRTFTALNSLAAALESTLTVFDPREPMSPLQQMKLRTARAVLENYPHYIKLHTPQTQGHHGGNASTSTISDTEKETEQPTSASGPVDIADSKAGDLPP